MSFDGALTPLPSGRQPPNLSDYCPHKYPPGGCANMYHLTHFGRIARRGGGPPEEATPWCI